LILYWLQALYFGAHNGLPIANMATWLSIMTEAQFLLQIQPTNAHVKIMSNLQEYISA
jgi:hypothetical protein